MGGMNEIAQAMKKVCEKQGVELIFNTAVKGVEINDKTLYKLNTDKGSFEADYFVASCDYEHFDKNILPEDKSNYSRKYWDSRTMSPSGLIFYLGVSKKIKNLLHHNLFFDESFDVHAQEIYENPQWPSKPLFYVSVTSKTDNTAPEGMENLFILVPVASGLEDSQETRDKYFRDVMDRLEKHTGESIRNYIIYNKSYAHKDFKSDYNAFKGNAYGLANTLMQTHILKPSIKSKKLKNLFYTGQLTVPGPGVPPSIISGKVVAKELLKLN
jgi:phytoene desaturase